MKKLKTILVAGAALFGAVQAWGTVWQQMTLKYVASSTTTQGGQSADMLLDNDPKTKWCSLFTSDGANWVEFTADAGVPQRLDLVAAAETDQYYQRNWKAWTLYGWDGSSWETIKAWSGECPTTTDAKHHARFGHLLSPK